MPCLSTFCCGYNLRSGGSFIGYVSIVVFSLLNVLCVIVLWSIKLRIDDAGVAGRGWNVFNRFSTFIRARSGDNEIEETLQDLKIFTIFILLYCLFLLLGTLSSSFLITGSRLRRPSYLLWWLIYQIFFVIISAGILAIFISIRDERYGLISYFKNYFFKTLVTTFIIINAAYIVLLIYFWISVLSLYSVLKRDKKKNNLSAAVIVENSSGTSSGGAASGSTETIVSTSGSTVQMIPINLGNSHNGSKDNSGKIFIIRHELLIAFVPFGIKTQVQSPQHLQFNEVSPLVMCSFAKFCACLSILRNSIWMGLLMISWSLINPQYKYALWLRIGLKIVEFYIIWSTYGAFKLFEGIKKSKPSKFFLFQLDCVISALFNFMALTIFIHQYLLYRKGLEFIITFSCSILINLAFYAAAKITSNQMSHERALENNLHNIVRGDCIEESASFDNWIRKTDKTHGNYTFEMVIDEINSIYKRES